MKTPLKRLTTEDLPAYFGKKVAVTVVGKTLPLQGGLMGSYTAHTLQATLLAYDPVKQTVKIRVESADGKISEAEVNPERIEALE